MTANICDITDLYPRVGTLMFSLHKHIMLTLHFDCHHCTFGGVEHLSGSYCLSSNYHIVQVNYLKLFIASGDVN